ncbi:MAG: hypothetical protein EBT05_02265 [Betaproteobacteria bacterium]|jgi:uncharacterized protein|nr:hypothetical protein [Betaproteobacteria bacterium]
MKIQPDFISVQSISAYGLGWIGVAGEKIVHSLVLGSRGERLDWNCQSFDELGVAHFAQLADLGPELVIFGSGQRLRFPQAAWLRPLIEQGVGVETMDTQAACRTYNILAGEGRHVIVALLLEPISAP